MIVVDTAHGHSQGVLDRVTWVKKHFPKFEVIGGTYCYRWSAAKALVDAGADAVKVGIGPGSTICTTRIVAGVGVPANQRNRQCRRSFTWYWCSLYCRRWYPLLRRHIQSHCSGCAWCDAEGGMFCRHGRSAPGEVELYQGRSYKSYRGMGSTGAMRAGSSDRYFQDNNGNADKLVPEGIEGRVPYKGSVLAVIHQLMGGLRASMGYVGAASIEEMRNKAEFVQITSAGMRESHVHDVQITKEAPNYRID